jgi:hypothetical protein
MGIIKFDTSDKLVIPEQIGNQEYYEHDTVYCISLNGVEYSGFLGYVGNSCFITLRNKTEQYEFRYKTVNPCRMVLIEKTYYGTENFNYESSTSLSLMIQK